MFEYLQPADRPVIDGLEAHELVMAKNQPEYRPLRCLPSKSLYRIAQTLIFSDTDTILRRK